MYHFHLPYKTSKPIMTQRPNTHLYMIQYIISLFTSHSQPIHTNLLPSISNPYIITLCHPFFQPTQT